MIHYILTNKEDVLITYNPENNYIYNIKLNKCYSLSHGMIELKDIEYNTLVGRTVVACKNNIDYIIPCGIYMFNTKNIAKTTFKLEYTINELKTLFKKGEISVNKLKELLNIDIIATRRVAKVWINNKEVNHITDIYTR